MSTENTKGHAPVKRILFVCSGNICRSPLAEGIARHALSEAGLAHRVEVRSAGTHGFHAGEAPDPRALRVALRHGYDLSSQRARRLESSDFEAFDQVLAMDAGHMKILRRLCPESLHAKLEMFMAYAATSEQGEVPDPYFGSEEGFEVVLGYCEDAVRGLVAHLRNEANPDPAVRLTVQDQTSSFRG